LQSPHLAQRRVSRRLGNLHRRRFELACWRFRLATSTERRDLGLFEQQLCLPPAELLSRIVVNNDHILFTSAAAALPALLLTPLRQRLGRLVTVRFRLLHFLPPLWPGFLLLFCLLLLDFRLLFFCVFFVSFVFISFAVLVVFVTFAIIIPATTAACGGRLVLLLLPCLFFFFVLVRFSFFRFYNNNTRAETVGQSDSRTTDKQTDKRTNGQPTDGHLYSAAARLQAPMTECLLQTAVSVWLLAVDRLMAVLHE
jgi:hypothetical protein